MALPIDVQQPHENDPLVTLPLPSPLPNSPLQSLPEILTHLDSLLAGSEDVPTVLTARMRQMTRDAYALMNAGRLDAADSRADLDKRDTVLRGVEYERNRIREEIERCMEYVPAYPAAELPTTEEFLSSASDEVKQGLPEVGSEVYEYAIIVAQLEQELKDIQAREADVENLTKDRDNLSRAKKEVKKRFDSTETWLNDYSRTTATLLSRLQAPLAIDPPILSSLSTTAEATATEDDQMDTA